MNMEELPYSSKTLDSLTEELAAQEDGISDSMAQQKTRILAETKRANVISRSKSTGSMRPRTDAEARKNGAQTASGAAEAAACTLDARAEALIAGEAPVGARPRAKLRVTGMKFRQTGEKGLERSDSQDLMPRSRSLPVIEAARELFNTGEFTDDVSMSIRKVPCHSPDKRLLNKLQRSGLPDQVEAPAKMMTPSMDSSFDIIDLSVSPTHETASSDELEVLGDTFVAKPSKKSKKSKKSKQAFADSEVQRQPEPGAAPTEASQVPLLAISTPADEEKTEEELPEAFARPLSAKVSKQIAKHAIDLNSWNLAIKDDGSGYNGAGTWDTPRDVYYAWGGDKDDWEHCQTSDADWGHISRLRPQSAF